nr:uncharacterized protein LOC109178464 [Ipomoea batatas]
MHNLLEPVHESSVESESSHTLSESVNPTSTTSKSSQSFEPCLPSSQTQPPQPSIVSSPSPAHSDQSRLQRQRRPNPKYCNHKFVNVTTTHPITASIEPRTGGK